MTAIVTNGFKNQLIRSLITDLQDSDNNYYIGYAKSDEWNTTDTPPTTTVNADREERNFRLNLQSVIKTTDLSFIVPRYNWVSGTIYRAYRDDQTATQNGQYYVFTESNRVYLCIRQGRDANGNAVISTVNPDTIGTGTTVSGATQPLADGYVWKYLYTVSASNLNKFATANFIPVEFVDSANDLAAIPQEQKNIQDAAVAGSIVGYNVINAGTGYTSAPTLTIVGNGSNAKARASVTSSGSIGSVVVDDSAGGFPFGAGYEYAELTVSGGGGSGASIRPIISKGGLGADPRVDLKSTTAMFNAKPSGDVNGDFLIGGQDFRQIGLIKNPKIPTSRSSADSDFTGANASALNILTLQSPSGIAADQVIVGQTDGGRAFVDKFESNKVYYHQNENTGFTPFSLEVVQDSANALNAGTITADSDGEIDPFSGNILYIENRSAVTRDAAQTEDVKIIIQL